MVALTTKSHKEEEEEDRPNIGPSGGDSTHETGTTMANTPEKQRKSKKTVLAPVLGRTPPKPPEGSLQRKKKKKVSESPTSTSNRYAPLASNNADEEDSSADANVSHDLESVKKTDEKDVVHDPQAAATNHPTQQVSPGSGSNGVGRAK